MIAITKDVAISDGDVWFKFSRSAGPGGQNVNKVNTRVELFFDINNCPALNDVQKKRIINKLKSRIDKNGVLRIVSQQYRRQKANQRAAVERFAELLKSALARKPRRIPTKIPYKAKMKRLENKRIRSEIKQQRTEKNE